MVRRLLSGAILAALLLAVACGDDDDDSGDSAGDDVSPGAALTLEEYFAKLLEVGDKARADIAALDDEYPDAFKGDVQQTKESFDEYVIIFDDAHQEFLAIEPPQEVASLHDEARAVDTSQSAINHDRQAQLADAETAADVDEIFATTDETQDLFDRGVANCEALHALAEENNIDYDVPCGE